MILMLTVSERKLQAYVTIFRFTPRVTRPCCG